MKCFQLLVPPVYLMLTLLLMGILHYFLPIIDIIDPPVSYFGILILLGGILVVIACAVMFKKVDTPIVPFEPTTVLLTHGIYRFTRNPIYLGMIFILSGAAIALGSLTSFLVIPVFFFIIQEAFIKHEERFLEKIFNSHYIEYKSSVRRWL